MEKHTTRAFARPAAWLQERQLWLLVAASIWLGAILMGFWLLVSHDTDAAQSDQPLQPTLVRGFVEQLPTDLIATVAPPEGELNVIVAMHPKCPCTRTTLTTLKQLLAIDAVTTRVRFLVYRPSGRDQSWSDSPTTKIAAQFPNAEMVVDINGERALQLGLNNSGALIVVQPSGVVAFRGGITSGRTCSVENPGSESVRHLLHRDSVAAITTPAFGCPIR